ncbi:MAG: PEP-CTERM/exosortase system-associated acyltransferase [Gallionellaceae bacterium]
MNIDQTEMLRMETDYFLFEEVLWGTLAYELYLEFRYEIFCKELRRVVPPPSLLSSRPMETDQYDVCSRHFIAYHKTTSSIAASARVILPSPIGLNVTPRYIIDRPLPYPDATDDNIGEISRMAIAPQFRRRHEDQNKPFQGGPESEMSFQQEKRRRHQPELVLGMYREIYQMSKQQGVSYCMAAMDDRFSRLLNTLGFPFKAVGPVNKNVQPPRRVYLISAVELERSLNSREARILSFLQAKVTGNPDACPGTPSPAGCKSGNLKK